MSMMTVGLYHSIERYKQEISLGTMNGAGAGERAVPWTWAKAGACNSDDRKEVELPRVRRSGSSHERVRHA